MEAWAISTQPHVLRPVTPPRLVTAPHPKARCPAIPASLTSSGTEGLVGVPRVGGWRSGMAWAPGQSGRSFPKLLQAGSNSRLSRSFFFAQEERFGQSQFPRAIFCLNLHSSASSSPPSTTRLENSWRSRFRDQERSIFNK